MSDERPRGSLRRVGALWKPRPGSKSLGSGSVTVGGLKQRFIVLKNDRKPAGSKEPDYLLMSSDEPEADRYAQRPPPSRSAAASPPNDSTTQKSPVDELPS